MFSLVHTHTYVSVYIMSIVDLLSNQYCLAVQSISGNMSIQFATNTWGTKII